MRQTSTLLALFIGCLATLLPSALLAQSFPLRSPAVEPNFLAQGSDGAMWFTTSNSQIGKLQTSGQYVLYSLPPSAGNAGRLVLGPDANLWFTESSGALGQISPSGEIQEFSLPGNIQANDLISGPDGNLWFTDSTAPRLGRMTPEGAVRFFNLPPRTGFLAGLTTGPDGSIWYARRNANVVGRIRPSGDGITEFSVGAFNPSSIVGGNDGNIWFSSFDDETTGQGKFIVAIDTRGNIVKSAPLRADGPPDFENLIPHIVDLTAGPNGGSLWFTQHMPGGSRFLGTMTYGGTLQQRQIGDDPGLLRGITTDRDGNIWYADASYPRIVRFKAAVVKIATADFPTLTEGVPATLTFSAAGGREPYAWSLREGNVPPGTDLSSAGQISGTPAMPGISTFKIRAVDSDGTPVVQDFAVTVSSESQGTINERIDSSTTIVTPVESPVIPAPVEPSLSDSSISATPTPVVENITALLKPNLVGTFGKVRTVRGNVETQLQVKNSGKASSKRMNVKVYLSTDRKASKNDRLILNKNYPSLTAGRAALRTLKVRTSQARGRFLVACIDCTNKISEMAESDNLLVIPLSAPRRR